MTAEHIRELDSIGFDWDPDDDCCSVRFQQLCEYKEQPGHCLVAQRNSANLTLGVWVSTQRINYMLYQGSKPSPMTAERIRELESIGFVWNQLDHAWKVRFEELRELTAQCSRNFVPIRYSANPTLGLWVDTQLTNYKLYQKRKSFSMTEERIRELKSIGFV